MAIRIQMTIGEREKEMDHERSSCGPGTEMAHFTSTNFTLVSRTATHVCKGRGACSPAMRKRRGKWSDAQPVSTTMDNSVKIFEIFKRPE